MLQSQTAGHLDLAYFFRSIGQSGGFLVVQGWFCATGQQDVMLSADLRIADSVVRIHCREPRPDVAAAYRSFKLHSGFNVIIPVATNVADGEYFFIQFSANAQPYGSLVGRVIHPEQEIAQHVDALSELRVKKLRNLYSMSVSAYRLPSAPPRCR